MADKADRKAKAAAKPAKAEKGEQQQKKGPPAPAIPRVPARLRERYRREVVPALTRQFSYTNGMQVPKVVKVVLNMGLGEAVGNAKVVDVAVAEMAAIAGQKPVVTRAKKSEASFKLRAGMPIGCKVTLRGERMYEFLERFMGTALPRQRDFRGVPSRAFDGRGNYSIGIADQTIFPEIELDKIKRQQGMDITIVTTANSNDEAKDLLKLMGMPFAN